MLSHEVCRACDAARKMFPPAWARSCTCDSLPLHTNNALMGMISGFGYICPRTEIVKAFAGEAHGSTWGRVLVHPGHLNVIICPSQLSSANER